MSQKEFAASIGINPHLYHSLELGRANITEENAYRIFEQTGAAPSTLDHRKNSIAHASNGNPYSEKDWIAWRKYLAKEHLHWAQTSDLMNWMHLLCNVARKQGTLRLAQRALARALKQVAADCQLEGIIKEQLCRIKLKTDVQFTYGALRNNKLLAQEVGFKDRPTLSDDELWQGAVEGYVRWDPFGYCPPEVTKRLKPLWTSP